MTEGSEPTSTERLMAIFAYAFFFIPLIAIPRLEVSRQVDGSNFIKFHTSQSITLFLANLIFSVFYGLLLLVMHRIGAPSGAFQMLTVAWLIPLSFLVIGVRNASQGKEKPLPLIGKLHINL